jgi:hypothetical protein
VTDEGGVTADGKEDAQRLCGIGSGFLIASAPPRAVARGIDGAGLGFELGVQLLLVGVQAAEDFGGDDGFNSAHLTNSGKKFSIPGQLLSIHAQKMATNNLPII